ncbi:uncharacterized protein [Dendropsophus ebraccatus]|uniref:uncharacterized protein n=1 Tax=Dendropsophus ebraccatus TaxID=150705 RepID=UPI003831F0A2
MEVPPKEIPGPSGEAPIIASEGEEEEEAEGDEQLSGLEEPGELLQTVETQGEDTAKKLMPIELVDNIVKAVRQTMAIEDNPQPRSIQDIMFEGLAPRQRPVFPIHQSLKTLIANEWARSDRKFFVPRAYKRKYLFNADEVITWETAPKIDPPVAKLTRKDALPFEDSASMKDPMDKRAEVYLRKNWEATTATFRPLIATTSVARATEIWVTTEGTD